MRAMQLCLAYRNEGGRVIVVLSLVPKTEMEETFRFIIPQEERYRSTFVFRQGNPLLPDALRVRRRVLRRRHRHRLRHLQARPRAHLH